MIVYTDESYVNQNHRKAQTWLKVDGDGRVARLRRGRLDVAPSAQKVDVGPRLPMLTAIRMPGVMSAASTWLLTQAS